MAALLMPVPLFDAVLGVTIIGIAVRVLTTTDLFQAIVLFIVFGLLMSLAWTRLHAVDVALAEAAIGAGLTGALFLNALAQSEHRDVQVTAGSRRAPWLVRVPILLLGSALTLVVASSLTGLPADAVGLSDAVETDLQRSGASNPVTAVLLNFRAYDTLLEIAVLIAAVMGVWGLGPAPPPVRGTDSPPGSVLRGLVRVLIPLMAVVAGYLLWIGSSASGGAFQAGAVLGASGILLIVSGIASAPTLRTWPGRAMIVAGFSVFLAVSLGVMAGQRHFLEYPPERASSLILLIEGLLTLSIAATLVALFSGGPPMRPRGAASSRP